MQATARVQAEPELIPLNPRGAMGARTAYNLHVTHDIDVEFGSNYSAKPAAQRVRIADLVVRGASGRRMIVSLADGRSWPLMQFLGPQLRSIVVSEFKPMRRKARTPRVSIDRLVVQRAGWRYPAGAIACARLKDRAARYAAWREFSAAAQMPRRLFYRLQGELKPLFLDNHSLVYVDLFLDGVRRLAPQAEVDLGEMLPGPDECWVTDSEGARYTAELRLGAFCGVADE